MLGPWNLVMRLISHREHRAAKQKYLPALKNSGIVWDRDSLARWRTNPQALVPGAKMLFALPNAQDRADVIAYLAEQR